MSVRALTSSTYWENRYAGGGDSGAGSFGALAEYKAQFINRFIAENGVQSVLELGCGDGNQAERLKAPAYTGVDVSPTALDLCRARCAGRAGWSFETLADGHFRHLSYDLCLSMDVVYHLIEDDIFNAYIDDLFLPARRFVIVYASDWDEKLTVWHVRHRWFSAAVARRHPDWHLTLREPNPFPFDPQQPRNTTFSDFHVFERLGGAT